MTHAYDEICLARASDTLGRMLDYSVYSLHFDISSMMELFIASGDAARFEHGDINLIAGMSGIELAYDILEQSGLAYDRTQPRYTKTLSAEYWCGCTLARIQWQSCLPFSLIMRSFDLQEFISEYGKSRFSFLDRVTLNITEAERAAEIKKFGSDFAASAASRYLSLARETSGAAAAPASELKRMRVSAGLSQSGLARASGIPVRTIQQYEQGQKDLSKARAEYLIALSRALSCDPSQLIIR